MGTEHKGCKHKSDYKRHKRDKFFPFGFFNLAFKSIMTATVFLGAKSTYSDQFAKKNEKNKQTGEQLRFTKW